MIFVAPRLAVEREEAERRRVTLRSDARLRALYGLRALDGGASRPGCGVAGGDIAPAARRGDTHSQPRAKRTSTDPGAGTFPERP